MDKVKKIMAEVQAKVKELEKERGPKYGHEEPVMVLMKPRRMKAFVQRSFKQEGSWHYDLILMEPMFPGSAVCHTVRNMPEVKLMK